jgi:hypothetical protein
MLVCTRLLSICDGQHPDQAPACVALADIDDILIPPFLTSFSEKLILHAKCLTCLVFNRKHFNVGEWVSSSAPAQFTQGCTEQGQPGETLHLMDQVHLNLLCLSSRALQKHLKSALHAVIRNLHACMQVFRHHLAC